MIPNKVIKKTDTSEAFLEITEDSTVIAGDAETRITSSGESGNMIQGKVLFTAHPEELRIGGFYLVNGLHTSTMASTIVTPMPLLQYSNPLADTVEEIKNLASEIGSMF